MRKLRRIAPVMLAALVAAYLGARTAAPEPGGLALAAGGGAGNPADGLVAVTTGAPGDESNRLVLINTVVKRILVYRITSTGMWLTAAREYKRDLQVAPTVEARGHGFSYDEVKEAVALLKQQNPKALKAPVGAELVLTTQGGDRNGREETSSGNRIVLINRRMKIVLVYRLGAKSIRLVAARPYNYDEMLLASPPPGRIRGVGMTYDQVKKMVDDADKAAALRNKVLGN
jgi:hypothetical protein